VCHVRDVGEQDEAGCYHREGLRRGGRSVVDVRHSSETHSRVQAAAAEHSTRHHALQPTQEEPKHALCATNHHDRRQGTQTVTLIH